MRPTVVLVDDDANIREGIRRTLKDEPIRLLMAESAQHCVDLLAVTDVQVLVSDLQMPGYDGTTLINFFKDARPDVIRIVLSGNLNLDVVLELINRGQVFRCLKKPCPGPLLSLAVREAIEQSYIVARTRRLLSCVKSQCDDASASLGQTAQLKVSDLNIEPLPSQQVSALIREATREVEFLDTALGRKLEAPRALENKNVRAADEQ